MMTDEDLRYFRDKLESLAADIRASLALEDSTKDSITPDTAIGRLTRMEAIQSQHLMAAGRRQLEARLQRIRLALEGIEAGSYGACTRCGSEIPRGRLEIMPESRLCVRCAARGR